jgi:hypothetical protein
MARMNIGEILRAVSQQKTKQGKLELLQHSETMSPEIASYLRHVFDPNLKFLIPEGEIKYTPNKNVNQEEGKGAFFHHIRRLYLFLEGCPTQLTPEHRMKLFVNMLESIDPLDAEAVVAMKDKKLPYGIPKKLIEEAYPNFLPKEKAS